MGADRAIHVEVNGDDYENLQPLAVSKILAGIIQQEKADLLFVGKQVKKIGNFYMYIYDINNLSVCATYLVYM